MKTTIYELLGMIKDNNAPKKIKYTNEDGDTYIYELEKDNSYWCKEVGGWLFSGYEVQTILNDEVEILETTNKPDKIEKLLKDKIIKGEQDGIVIWEEIYRINEIGDKINEIIEVLNDLE